MIDEQGRRFQDLITFRPHPILNISPAQRNLLDEYKKIINALRQENKTVKELHELYYDPETRKHTKTIKTIYRYVGILEENDLIVAAGQRVTEGSRVVEKVYSISSLYFHDTMLSLDYWETDESRQFATNIGSVLADVTQNPAYEQALGVDAIHKLLKIFSTQEYFNILEIQEKVKKDESMRQMILKHQKDELDVVGIVSTLLFYLRSYDLIEEFIETGR